MVVLIGIDSKEPIERGEVQQNGDDKGDRDDAQDRGNGIVGNNLSHSQNGTDKYENQAYLFV